MKWLVLATIVCSCVVWNFLTGEEGVCFMFALRCLSRYPPKQVYDVVAAVHLYEDFVPYCQRSQVLWTKGDELEAELEIGFKFFVERYISHVQLKAPHQIKVYFLPFPGYLIVIEVQLIEQHNVEESVWELASP